MEISGVLSEKVFSKWCTFKESYCNIRPRQVEDTNVGLTRRMDVPTTLPVVAELDSSHSSKRSSPAKLEQGDIFVQSVKQT